jgi:hypothetical protein
MLTRTFVVIAMATACIFTAPGVAAGATIEGNAGDNTLWGTRTGDRIYGFRGDDKLYGRGGEDRLSGGPGNDYLKPGYEWGDVALGGAGNDRLIGDGEDSGKVNLLGGSGNDVLYVGRQDAAWGEGGADVFVSQAGATYDADIYGGDGNDRFSVYASYVRPGPGRDTGTLRHGGRLWAKDGERDTFVCDGQGDTTDRLRVESRDAIDSIRGKNGCRIIIL